MIYSFIKDLLFPIECLGCQEPGAWVCQNCFRQLKYGGPSVNLVTGQNNFLDNIYIAGDYDDPLLSELIKKFKYHFIPDLKEPLSDFLALFWAGRLTLEPKLYQAKLLPIPLSKKRERWRGFNQAELLSNGLCNRLGLESLSGLLRTKHLAPQSSLTSEERRLNILGAFSWTGPTIIDEHLILIDDVVTTGSTLEAAAQVLKEAGAAKVSALVLAKG